jgi:uncharacterized protein (DUF885 family)
LNDKLDDFSQKAIDDSLEPDHQLSGRHTRTSHAGRNRPRVAGASPFRQNEYYVAYTEGWALYSERLGREVGFFRDPYSYYGHLQDAMLGAIRLVVDTGFHYKRWTRQQVVDFFHEHSAIDEPDGQSETDRYIALPAQAVGYKVGQLEILKLRHMRKNSWATSSN